MVDVRVGDYIKAAIAPDYIESNKGYLTDLIKVIRVEDELVYTDSELVSRLPEHQSKYKLRTMLMEVWRFQDSETLKRIWRKSIDTINVNKE